MMGSGVLLRLSIVLVAAADGAQGESRTLLELARTKHLTGFQRAGLLENRLTYGAGHAYRYSAEVDEREAGSTALDYVSAIGDIRSMRVLLNRGASIESCYDVRDDVGQYWLTCRSALWKAAEAGQVEAARLLLRRGAAVEGMREHNVKVHPDLASLLGVEEVDVRREKWTRGARDSRLKAVLGKMDWRMGYDPTSLGPLAVWSAHPFLFHRTPTSDRSARLRWDPQSEGGATANLEYAIKHYGHGRIRAQDVVVFADDTNSVLWDQILLVTPYWIVFRSISHEWAVPLENVFPEMAKDDRGCWQLKASESVTDGEGRETEILKAGANGELEAPDGRLSKALLVQLRKFAGLMVKQTDTALGDLVGKSRWDKYTLRGEPARAYYYNFDTHVFTLQPPAQGIGQSRVQQRNAFERNFAEARETDENTKAEPTQATEKEDVVKPQENEEEQDLKHTTEQANLRQTERNNEKKDLKKAKEVAEDAFFDVAELQRVLFSEPSLEGEWTADAAGHLLQQLEQAERYAKKPDVLRVIEDTELRSMLGLYKVKSELVNLVEEQWNEKRRGGGNRKKNYHMVFQGNPGTGKTETGKLIARLLHTGGLVANNKFEILEGRKDVVGKYKGQECAPLMERIERARGGVLLIDEAPSIVQKDGEKKDLGEAALVCLNTEMNGENARRKDTRVTFIFTGYADEMQKSLAAERGTGRRIEPWHTFTFPDFTPRDLSRMILRGQMQQSVDFQLKSDVAVQSLETLITKTTRADLRSKINGGLIENFGALLNREQGDDFVITQRMVCRAAAKLDPSQAVSSDTLNACTSVPWPPAHWHRQLKEKITEAIDAGRRGACGKTEMSRWVDDNARLMWKIIAASVATDHMCSERAREKDMCVEEYAAVVLQAVQTQCGVSGSDVVRGGTETLPVSTDVERKQNEVQRAVETEPEPTRASKEENVMLAKEKKGKGKHETESLSQEQAETQTQSQAQTQDQYQDQKAHDTSKEETQTEPTSSNTSMTDSAWVWVTSFVTAARTWVSSAFNRVTEDRVNLAVAAMSAVVIMAVTFVAPLGWAVQIIPWAVAAVYGIAYGWSALMEVFISCVWWNTKHIGNVILTTICETAVLSCGEQLQPMCDNYAIDCGPLTLQVVAWLGAEVDSISSLCEILFGHGKLPWLLAIGYVLRRESWRFAFLTAGTVVDSALARISIVWPATVTLVYKFALPWLQSDDAVQVVSNVPIQVRVLLLAGYHLEALWSMEGQQQRYYATTSAAAVPNTQPSEPESTTQRRQSPLERHLSDEIKLQKDVASRYAIRLAEDGYDTPRSFDKLHVEKLRADFGWKDGHVAELEAYREEQSNPSSSKSLDSPWTHSPGGARQALQRSAST